MIETCNKHIATMRTPIILGNTMHAVENGEIVRYIRFMTSLIFLMHAYDTMHSLIELCEIEDLIKKTR